MQTGQMYLNSINDPAGNFGTGQPYTHDQWSTLYEKYIVVGWKVDIEVVTQDNTTPMMVGFCPSAQGTISTTDYLHYGEQPGNTSRLVTPDTDKIYLSAKGGVKRFLQPAFGNFLSNPDFQANFGSNPSKLLYGHMYVQSIDPAADIAQCYFVVKLTQLCKFWLPKVPERS